jgi:K+-transporting ATPase ATPase C chain
MLTQARAAIVSTLFFTLLLGVAYPLAVTGIGKLAFPRQAEGSLIHNSKGEVIGSSLIGQNFTKPEYLHPRPSAAGMDGYDASGSSGSNYGPMSDDLAKRVAASAADLRKESTDAIPEDAVTTSGSGLDPDISPNYAKRQAARIATARGVSAPDVQAIIAANTTDRWLGIFGQPHVNVLMTNLALDTKAPIHQAPAASPPPAPALAK